MCCQNAAFSSWIPHTHHRYILIFGRTKCLQNACLRLKAHTNTRIHRQRSSSQKLSDVLGISISVPPPALVAETHPPQFAPGSRAGLSRLLQLQLWFGRDFGLHVRVAGHCFGWSLGDDGQHRREEHVAVDGRGDNSQETDGPRLPVKEVQ